MVVVLESDRYRANGEAFFAREQLQRTFAFAMGSDAVFVPQVEAYKKDFVDWIFADTSLTLSEFVWGGGVSQRSHFAPKIEPRRNKEGQLSYTQVCFWQNPVVYDFWKESFDVSSDDIHFQHRVYR